MYITAQGPHLRNDLSSWMINSTIPETKLWQDSVISLDFQQKLEVEDKRIIFLKVDGDWQSVYLAKVIMPIEYTHYSRWFPEWATPDIVILHVQFSSGVAIWQRVLQQMVNTANIHSNRLNKWCAMSRQEIVFVITLEFLLTITWHYTVVTILTLNCRR